MLRFSYAKINLALNVTNKSKPKDLHDLDMINASITLKDTLKFKFVNKGNDIIINCNNKDIPVDNSNLIAKVINKYKKVFNLEFTTLVDLKKNIPCEAGLGGGSSNASATLNALDKKFKSKMTVLQKMNFIKEITSDGPFMFVKGIARVKGIGDEVTPLISHFRKKVVIVKPEYGFSTAKVYGSLDYKNLVHPNINKVEQAIIDNDFSKFVSSTNNSLYEACKSLNPNIENVVNDLKNLGFEFVMMSGSGSAIYAISNNKEPYKKFNKEFNKEKYSFTGIYKIRKMSKLYE